MARLRSARSVSRKSTPLSPPKPRPSTVTAEASQTPRPTRPRSREVTAAQQQLQNIDLVLEPVGEEVELHQEIAEDLESIDLPSSSGGASYLEAELDVLDRDAIVDSLVDLFYDSAKLLLLFEGLDDDTLRSQCDKLWQPESSQRRRFQTRIKRLLDTRKAFGTHDYIVPDLIALKIANRLEYESLPESALRPLLVIYIANLALGIGHVFSSSPEDRTIYPEYMTINFPMPVAGTHHYPLHPDLVADAVDLSIDVLTQFYIQQAAEKQSDASFDPDVLASQVFWDDDDQIRGYQHETTQQKIIHRVQVIRKHFRTDPQKPLDLEGLKQQFSWSDFAVKVLKWSLARKAHIDALIRAKGGVDMISEAIISGAELDETPKPTKTHQEREDEPHRRDTVVATTEKTPPLTMTRLQGPPTTKALRAESSRLRDLRARLAASRSAIGADPIDISSREASSEVQLTPQRVIPQSPTPAAESEPAADDDNEVEQPLVDAEEEGAQFAGDEDVEQPALEDAGEEPRESEPPSESIEEEILQTQQSRIIMATLERQQQQSEKENIIHDRTDAAPAKKRSLLDRQPNAEKVPWSEPADDEATPRPAEARKRQRPAESEESEEDDEFETDARSPKKPRIAAESSRRHLPWHSTPEASAIEDDTAAQGHRDRASQSRRQRTRSPEQRPRISSKLPSASQPAPARTSTQHSRPKDKDRAPLRPVADHTRPPPSTAPARSRPREATTTHSPPRRGTSPLIPDLKAVNAEAKRNTQISRELLRGGSAIQVRKPYTEAEVHRLMELVELLGPKWSAILQEDMAHVDGPLLQSRDQVGLKDKARNIKLDFLKYVSTLENPHPFAVFPQPPENGPPSPTSHLVAVHFSKHVSLRGLRRWAQVLEPPRETGCICLGRCETTTTLPNVKNLNTFVR